MENRPNNNDKTSDAGSMDDTEHRIMMAYATRRRSAKEVKGQTQPGPVASNGSADSNPTTPPKTEKNKTQEEKKKKKKKVPFFLRCIKPKTKETELEVSEAASHDDVHDRAFVPGGGLNEDEDGINEVAARAMEIAKRIKFVHSGLEHDTQEGEVEKAVGLLLRETGDQLDEKLKELNISLDVFLNYTFFSSVVKKFLEMAGLRNPSSDDLEPLESPTTQIAVTCEITSRLSVLETLPRNRLLDHGARFLKENYSPWIQTQGGYEAAFQCQDELD